MAKAQHSPIYDTVPGVLRQLRETAGLTQRDIGGYLKKPQSWVYNCETGNRRVDVAEFMLWCAACGVTGELGLARLRQESSVLNRQIQKISQLASGTTLD